MKDRSYAAALRKAKSRGFTSYINRFGFRIDIEESLEMLDEEETQDEEEQYLLIDTVIIAYHKVVDEDAEVFGICE